MSVPVSSTPLKDSKRSRDMVSPLNPGEDNPEKKICPIVGDSIDGSNTSNASNVSMSSADKQYHYVSPPMHSADISRIAFELKAIMIPDLECLLERKMSTIDEIIKKAVDEVRVPYEKAMEEMRAENARLSEKCASLESQIEQCALSNDDLEQYSRRNCLLISGVPQQEHESTDRIVLNLAKDLDVNLKVEDIDRSHRVGSKSVKDIIVKFTSYRSRHELYSRRKSLKDCGPDLCDVYINEALTARRGQLLFDARQLVKKKLLIAAYSTDGKINVLDKNKQRHRIKCHSDLIKFNK